MPNLVAASYPRLVKGSLFWIPSLPPQKSYKQLRSTGQPRLFFLHKPQDKQQVTDRQTNGKCSPRPRKELKAQWPYLATGTSTLTAQQQYEWQFSEKNKNKLRVEAFLIWSEHSLNQPTSPLTEYVPWLILEPSPIRPNFLVFSFYCSVSWHSQHALYSFISYAGNVPF